MVAPAVVAPAAVAAAVAAEAAAVAGPVVMVVLRRLQGQGEAAVATAAVVLRRL